MTEDPSTAMGRSISDMVDKPTMSLPELGRLLGVSEPVIREQHRRGELESLGIRVLPVGRQFRVVTSTVREVLGIDVDGSAERPE